MRQLSVLFLPLVLLLAACDKPKDDPDFRVFASEIAGAIQRNDGEFFGRRADTTVIECPHPQVPFCDLLQAGDDVRVFSVRTALEGTIIPVADYIGLLTYWFASSDASLSDSYGNGAPVLQATARTRPSPDAPEEMHALVSAIPTPPWGNGLRTARIISWRYGEDSRWHIIYDTLLDSFNPQVLQAWLDGNCPACYKDWQRWP